MPVVTRIRAYAGLWLLTALLGAMMVLVAAAAGPITRDVEDRALRQTLAEQPPTIRDLTVTDPADPPVATAEATRDRSVALLPPALADAVGASWGIQRTQVRAGAGSEFVASVNGEGVDTELSASMPVASLHHQTGLLDELTITEGTAPATERTGSPATTVIEVIASAAVAEQLGLRVGGDYELLPGVAAQAPMPAGEAAGAVPIRLTGVFEPRDPAAAVWQSDPRLLSAGTLWWVFPDGSITPLRQAALVTDQPGLNTVAEGTPLVVHTGARIRLADQRVDAAGVDELRDAVAELLSHPELPPLQVATGLLELIEEYERQAAAARALAAVVLAGLIGIGVGLLVLAARLTLDRRREEVSLLRARGASVPVMVGRLLAEAAFVVIPAIAVGWLLHLVVIGARAPGAAPGLDAIPLAVAAVALLALPVMLAVDLRRRPGLAAARRDDLRRSRSAPLRITVEVVAIVLAGLGVLLLHRRGLNLVAGTDPYLSAVPVLVAVAAGLLALRLYVPPLRAFGAMTARRRGVVGFLGLARAGRAAPVSAVPLLVLVLAVAIGGFAGAVYASVAAARDTAVVQAVGADVRLVGGGLTEESVAAVAAVPGVTAVAAAHHDGLVRVGGSAVQGVFVVIVDAEPYQRILASIGASGRLPDEIVSARPGDGPVPILADRQIASRAGGLTAADALTVEIGQGEYEAEVVGDTAGLPELVEGERWVLVPRQALPEPTSIDELLLGGSGVDLAALREATGGELSDVELTTLADRRAELEESGFNQGLTMVFVVGAVGAAAGGVLAVGLALVVQAAARSHSLSLLRTMGLSSRQARGLLLVELTPVAALAVAAGAVTGVALPVLLAPALGLTEFTGGAPVEIGLDPRTVALLGGLLGVFVIGGALIEAAVNRRLGLGQVLRVD